MIAERKPAGKKPAQRRVGFAVVGLGSIAQSSVLPAFANCNNAKLVSLVGRDAAKTALLARKFNASSHYSSDEFSECLANPEVSAVYIATPQGQHASLTKGRQTCSL
jgi:predicted dehydrogenase